MRSVDIWFTFAASTSRDGDGGGARARAIATAHDVEDATSRTTKREKRKNEIDSYNRPVRRWRKRDDGSDGRTWMSRRAGARRKARRQRRSCSREDD